MPGPLYLAESDHDLLYSQAALRLGELHWYLLKSAQALSNRRHKFIALENGIRRVELTDFGKEVGADEINWWLTKKENNVPELRARATTVLQRVQTLKEAIDIVKAKELPSSYAVLVTVLRQFTTNHSQEIEELYNFIIWLHGRHELAPSILYAYRVWGSTRASDRWIDVDHQDIITLETMKFLAEIVLGLRTATRSTYDSVYLRIGQEVYDSISSDEETEGSRPVVVPSDQALLRTAWETYQECGVYFTEIRDSLRQILLDIEKLSDQESLIHSVSFWRDFITKACTVRIAEPQVWDIKQTLSMWHTRGSAHSKDKCEFVTDLAAFANARGGVMVVGVEDRTRAIIGIGGGQDLENRLQSAKAAIERQLDYSREIVTFKQVVVNSKVCLVIIVAQTCEAVAVDDGNGNFSYPLRLETGKDRSTLRDITAKKLHVKNDNIDFIAELGQFVRDQ